MWASESRAVEMTNRYARMVMSMRPLRVGIAVAKARLAEVVRASPKRRTIIQRRGADVAVVIGIDELRELETVRERAAGTAPLLARLATWRDAHGGDDDFAPEPARYAAEEPFAAPRRARRGR